MIVLKNSVFLESQNFKLLTVFLDHPGKKFVHSLPQQYIHLFRFSEVVRAFSMDGYLKRRKRIGEVDINGAVVWEITFGSRAYLEIGIGNIVKFMEQTTGRKFEKREKARMFGLKYRKEVV